MWKGREMKRRGKAEGERCPGWGISIDFVLRQWGIVGGFRAQQGLATKMVSGRCWRAFHGSLQTAVLEEVLFNHLFDTGRNCLDSHLVLFSPKSAAASETKTDN